MSAAPNSPGTGISEELLRTSPEIGTLLERALAEDIGGGDVTTEATVPDTCPARGAFLAKQELLVCGTPLLERLYQLADPEIVFRPRVRDGARIGPSLLAVVEGDARVLLRTERVALNFLQRLCGIATFTDNFTDELAGTEARLRDTRKTTPGLRLLEKYAVKVGGGVNHRIGLYDEILIKENHAQLAGGVGAAVAKARQKFGNRYPLQVEVRNEEELRAVLDAGPDSILLDNMTAEQVRACVEITAGRLPLEVSGGLTRENARAYAQTGVNYLSVGALTHSAPAVDISFDLAPRAS
jgi:nicotinate-nucleotide pyrophosphorylase (carboxylating)